MPRRDATHEAVKNALIKDDWTIIADPLRIKLETNDFYIDLAAEKVLVAEKGKRKIAVEIKTFLGDSLITEFYTALGQYLSYRIALSQQQSDYDLYLAVSSDIYQTFFLKQIVPKVAITELRLKLLVYHPQQEEIWQWIN